MRSPFFFFVTHSRQEGKHLSLFQYFYYSRIRNYFVALHDFSSDVGRESNQSYFSPYAIAVNSDAW